jgi:glutaminase
MSVARLSAVIPFDEIVPGATVRFCVKDGAQYLSIRDMIMCVCDKNQNDAGEVWRKLSDDKKSEVQDFVKNFQFPGRGQSEQPVITFAGALKLVMFLPGEAAKKHRSAMADILRRYYAGDASLMEEVITNNKSDSPVNEMARASLLADGGEDGGRIEDDAESRKRKREAVELFKMEVDA